MSSSSPAAPAAADAHRAHNVAYLVPISGPLLDPIQLSEKDDGQTIGRNEQCDICLPPDEERVSRFHARFGFHDGKWFVADLGSRWGSFLNGIRLTANSEMALKDGDLIRITPWTFMLSPTSKRAGSMLSQNDQGQTLVRAVTAERVRPLADDMLALLLESAAAIHAASDEKQLAELVMDAACRGTGLNNAAMLRPVDASGRIEVIASRSMQSNPAGSHGPTPAHLRSPESSMQTMGVPANQPSKFAATNVGLGFGGGPQPQATFSRSLIAAASNGVVAELSGGNLGEDISQSIVQMKINNAICVPLMLGSTVAQFLYLDSRGTVIQQLRPNGSAFCVALGRMASLALANLKRIEMEGREERIRADLTAASVAQKWIMPKRHTDHGPFHCIGESRAGQYVGGDFWDVIAVPDNKLAVAVGDVAGKGIAASVLMTATQGFLHASLLQHADPVRAVNALNKYVQPRKPESKFVTMWVGVFDPAEGIVRYVDAGHSYALVKRAGGGFENLNKGAGLPVGLDESGDYKVETAKIGPGDDVIIVSDGIVEQFGIVPRIDGTMGKEQFEITGVEHAMKNTGSDCVEDLFAAVIAHAGTNQLSDDATAVVVRWKN